MYTDLKPRKRTATAVQHMNAVSAETDLLTIKWNITNTILNNIGLKIVDNNRNSIPRMVWLSKIQKSWIRTVNKYGYFVGLL